MFVGKVSVEERDEIRELNALRVALEELLLILTPGSDLHRNATEDLKSNMKAYDRWWSETAARYGWPREKDSSWTIDFESCKVYLNTNY